MKNWILTTLFLAAVSALPAPAQEAETTTEQTPQAELTPEVTLKGEDALRAQLESVNEEHRLLIQDIKDKQLPLSQELNELQRELISLRAEWQGISRTLARRRLDLNDMQTSIKAREDHISRVSTILAEFSRKFRARLHIGELQAYEEVLDEADLAPSNSNLTDLEIYARQGKSLSVALDQIADSLGGSTLKGTAVTFDGLVREGTFVLLGPCAIFVSDDGEYVGTVEQPNNSSEPTQVPFSNELDVAAAKEIAAAGTGKFPLDTTLGNAHKIEATQETFLEHVEKGGLIMYPIFAMAGLAFLLAFYKFVRFIIMKLRMPSEKKFKELLGFVSRHDTEGAMSSAAAMKGPLGKMLRSGVEHIKEPRELIEEVMYESVLKSRLSLNSFLPFIAICAASAPLLGLLGTVTGIINTFKLLTVFGSGDVSNLSSGISEALITTKFGLIVAIPSLLIHAFLFRMARGVIARMESSAVAFANEVSMSPYAAEHIKSANDQLIPAVAAQAPAPSKEEVREQITGVLTEMLAPVVEKGQGQSTHLS